MFFNSIEFLVFFLIVYGLYLLLPHRGQNVLLLISSYFFYGCWDWRFLGLILISTLVDFWAGMFIAGQETAAKRKAALMVSICMNLGLLGFFKYYNFFIESAYSLLSVFGTSSTAWRLDIVLPVGISFYTFQTMSYTIDVYRGEGRPIRNLLDFGVFVAFFPQLVAGPIERATNLLPQVSRPRRLTKEGFETGCWLIFWGLFKKMVIADNLAVVADRAFTAGSSPGALMVLVGLYAFAYQIYCDFSGYSDIARGLARLMGFELMVNFRNPYFAINPQDFWRRWHISLSTWLRDYLYIPLGGSKKGARRTYINLALTMLLGGLWHGAAWTFVAWGAYQGFLLMVHRAFCGKYDQKRGVFSLVNCGKMMVMFHAACLGWLMFRASSLSQVGYMLGALFADWSVNLTAANSILTILVLCFPLWIVQIMQERTGDLYHPLKWSLVPKTALLTLCMIMFLGLAHTGGGAFIYFQF